VGGEHDQPIAPAESSRKRHILLTRRRCQDWRRDVELGDEEQARLTDSSSSRAQHVGVGVSAADQPFDAARGPRSRDETIAFEYEFRLIQFSSHVLASRPVLASIVT
jgi:hypothetical protein